MLFIDPNSFLLDFRFGQLFFFILHLINPLNLMNSFSFVFSVSEDLKILKLLFSSLLYYYSLTYQIFQYVYVYI